jgi:hypothetical protein
MTGQFTAVTKYRIRWEAGIFTLVFLTGTLTGLGIDQTLLKVINELLVVLYFLKVFHKTTFGKRFYFKLLIPFILIIGTILISMIMMGSDPVDSFYFARFYLSPALLFWGIFNSKLNEVQFRKINGYLFFLFAFQIVAQIAKSITYAGFSENPVGSITTAGGGIAAFIPLLAFGFALSFYINFKPNRIYWLWLIGFVFIGIASQKRAAFYFLPIVAAFFLIFNHKANPIKHTFKQLRGVIIVAIFLPMLIYLSASFSFITGQPGGNVDLSHLLQHAEEYSYARNEKDDLALGRFASFDRSIELISESDLKTNLLGHGPSTVKGFSRGDNKMEQFGFGGTFPGWTYQYIQIGLLGCGFYLLYLFMLFKRVYYKTIREKDPYWKAIEIGLLIGFVLIITDFVIYSITSLTMYAITYPAFYISAAVLRRKHPSRVE